MLQVEIDTRKLDQTIRIVPQELKMELGDAFDYIGRKFLKTFKQTRLQGPPGIRGRPHGIFKRIKRVMLNPMGDINNMGTAIYTKSKIARLHEEGGIVEASGGGSLAVPLSARAKMFTASGILKKRYKTPSRLRNVRLIVLKGKRFLAKFWKRSPDILPLFVLKNQIKIKPRLGFYATWESMENINIRRLNRAIYRAFEKV